MGRGCGELRLRGAAAAALTLASVGGELRAQELRDAVASSLLPRVRVEGRDRRFRIADRLAHYRVPGAAVAVVDRGRLDWSAGWGTTGTGAPVGNGTPFQVGGISQVVAALAVLRLAAAGELDLDAPVNDALRTWKLPVNALSASYPVTPRLLLRHGAGIGTGAQVGYTAAETLPSLQDVLEGSALAGTPPVRVEEAPGSAYVPSPRGYAILQKLIEDVARRPYRRVVRDELLEPLSLADSGFAPLPRALEERAAAGHDALGAPVSGGFRRYPIAAAAGLWSSARDLGGLLAAVQTALDGGATPLSGEPVREMLAAQGPGRVGLGWQLEGEGNAVRFRQTGATDGFRAEVVGWLEGGRGAVVLTNGDGGGALAAEVLASVASVYGWPGLVPTPRRVVTLASDRLAPLAGHYELGPHRSFEVRVEGGGLSLLQPGAAPVTLIPESETRFFSDEPPLEAEFVRDGSGQMVGVEIRVAGRSLPARRLP